MQRPRSTRIELLVVGSINMDLVARCPHIPHPGETVLGSTFTINPGGKGANGTTAAARLVGQEQHGAIAMLAAIGTDANGATALDNLRSLGVDVTHVLELPDVPTGVALIAVSDDGENSIVVVPGANAHLRPAHVNRVLEAHDPPMVLLQMEIPIDTVTHTAVEARRRGARVLLDPAPAIADMPSSLLAATNVLIPNESELALLTGMRIETEHDLARAAEALRQRGVQTVVVKRGADGALIVDGDGARHVASLRVDAVDTTGAGDCFDGALAVALLEGKTIDNAVRFATHAAALACTRLGAQSAQPSREEVDRRLSGEA